MHEPWARWRVSDRDTTVSDEAPVRYEHNYTHNCVISAHQLTEGVAYAG